MTHNDLSSSCFNLYESIFYTSNLYHSFSTPYYSPVVSVNVTRDQVLSIKYYCDQLSATARDTELEDKHSKPMVWIGVYIAVASLFCTLAMAADLWNGFRHGKLWFPSKYFSLNAVSITVITIAMKLPMDMNSSMGSETEQTAKVGSLVFMCTMVANLMPSVASIDNKELPANVIGLAILIITIIVNIIMEMSNGVIESYEQAIVSIYVVTLLFLLLVLISVAISVPISKQTLEYKYQTISNTSVNDQHTLTLDEFIIERLIQHVKRYGIMVETGSPQFIMASNVLFGASGAICGIGLVVYTSLVGPIFGYSYSDQSPYKWSTGAIGTIQFIGVVVGSIAPIFRCARQTKKPNIIFKVENYWTQKLYEWKESHITILSGSHRSRSVIRKLKRATLSRWIEIQKGTVVACKIICVIIVHIRILVKRCTDLLKSLKGMTSDTLPSNGDANPINGETSEDLSKYVLLLEDNMELDETTLKRISDFVNRMIQTAEKEPDNNLLKLLEKSTGFQGVLKFDIYQVEPPLFLDLPNSWSLPIATLTCIAIALPNVGSDITDKLFKSVTEGLSYTYLVDESLNNVCQYVNVQKAAITLWDEVEDKRKWLGNTLEKTAFEGKTTKEILEWFVDKAEEIFVNEVYNSFHGDPIEKLPQKLIAANSMKRIAQTIICTYNISEITKKQLFVLLSGMIADILVACFTNIPWVIAMKCHGNAIERREASVEAAAKLLGRTTKLIKVIIKHELPSMDPDKLAFIDEWRLHLQSIP